MTQKMLWYRLENNIKLNLESHSIKKLHLIKEKAIVHYGPKLQPEIKFKHVKDLTYALIQHHTSLFTYHTIRKHKAQMSDTQKDMIKLSTTQIEINRHLTNTYVNEKGTSPQPE